MNSPLRVAVVGAGNMGRNHARTLANLPGAVLAGVFDVDAAKAGAIAAEFNCGVLSSIDSVMDAADAAVIAVPTIIHADVAAPLLRKGIHCLVEKPLAVTEGECHALSAAAAAGKAAVLVGHIERYNPAIEALFTLGTAPADIRTLSARRMNPGSNRIIDVDVVLDLMIHDLDVILALKQSHVDNITVTGNRDHAEVQLRFSDSATANLIASRAVANRVRDLSITTSDGELHVDYIAKSLAVGDASAVHSGDALRSELTHFIACARGKAAPRVSAKDALEALKVAWRIQEKLDGMSDMVDSLAVPKASGLALVGWCLYDFANSAFTTIVVTFVFATYFTSAIAADPVTGAGQWSLAMAVAGIIIAVLSPICGAIADQTGRRKPWLLVMSVVCVFTTSMLWYAKPTPDDVTWTLTFVVISTIGFEMGMLFYNAMLPALASESRMGRISGWAWATGYAGGLIALALALVFLVQADPAPFGLEKDSAEHVRATALLTAAWFAVFAVPLFLFVRETPVAVISPLVAVKRGLAQLVETFRNVRKHKNVFRYLIAAMIYTDGVHTIFALGGVYAAATFGMTIAEVIQLGIALNLTAGLGAFAFAWVDDKIGSKRTIVISLIALMLTCSVVLSATDKQTFWIAALAMSTFFGPVQAASRTLMARLSPQKMRGEMFGLFALSGKATAFLGPALVGWVTLAFGSQRLGLATVLLFLLVGLLLLRGVKETP